MINNFSKKIILGVGILNIMVMIALYNSFKSNNNNSTEDINQQCNVEFLENNLVGFMLPKYEFKNENEVNVYQELTQKKVLLVVFTTGCDACLKEFSILNNQYAEIGTKIKIIGITSEAKGVVKQFIEENNIIFPIYFDSKGEMIRKTQIRCTPTSFFLENGIIKKIRVGITDNYKDLMEGL